MRAMRTYDTTLEIGASAEQVWDVLTDFPAYGEWNTALPSLSGELAVGSTLAMRLNLDGKAMDVTAALQTVDRGRGFSWKGHLGAEFIFCGRRAFTIEPVGPDAARFRHVESLNGLIVPVFMLLKGKAVAAHHHDFNAAIKQRVEELAGRS
jgi:hypothetical protein